MPYKDLDAKKEYQKQYHKEWYKKNKEKRLAQINDYSKTKPKEWRKNIGRRCHLNKRYNVTPEEYEFKLKQQDYKCAICNKDVTENLRNKVVTALSLDHDHKTKKIRDLLCFNCNAGLGQFKDSFELLFKAYEYLKKHK
jgi:hypothetical protein